MIVRKRGITKVLADLLNPYSWITATRNSMFNAEILKSHEPGIPTICIGNITVGGTGKTPHTEYIVRLLKDRARIAVLSRGYGRKSRGYAVAGPDTTVEMIGDEPFQIKNKFKETVVAVCEKRVTGIENITKDFKEIDVILLDDAFQHRHVKAGLNILLIDYGRPIWNDCILPFGRLRESEKGIKRADIVVMTKSDNIMPEERKVCYEHVKSIKNIPVFFSSMHYGVPYKLTDSKECISLNGRKILLVTGIANPLPLKKECERQGAEAELMRYGDHHNFTASDFKEIEQRFYNIGNEERIILTTEKDAARIAQHKDLSNRIKEHIFVMPIEAGILFNEERMFNQIIEDYVTENSRDRRIP